MQALEVCSVGMPAILCLMANLSTLQLLVNGSKKNECFEIKFLSSIAGQQINLCTARIDETHDDFILENYDFV